VTPTTLLWSFLEFSIDPSTILIILISLIASISRLTASTFRLNLTNSVTKSVALTSRPATAPNLRLQQFKMNLSTILSCVAILLLASSPEVDAFWRLLCHGTLGTAQIDPVVNFGQIAPHAHQIAGASSESQLERTFEHVRLN
jgi:hypothetical protein